MHPDQTAAIATQHRADLQRIATHHRLVRGDATGEGSRSPTRMWRRRTGWWLVALGLRLAVGRNHRHALAPAR